LTVHSQQELSYANQYEHGASLPMKSALSDIEAIPIFIKCSFFEAWLSIELCEMPILHFALAV
jgi:hypothetical protein